MFGDIGWAELLLIGVVALIVIGPEDLPGMFRQLGRFTAKIRQMSREFSRVMEDAAKESGVKDVAKDLKAVTSPGSLGLSKVKEAADRFEKWDPMKPSVKPATPTLTPQPPPTPLAEAAEKAAAPVAAATSIPAPVPAAPVIHGPATQALMDKKVAKQTVLAEATAKLKSIDAAPIDAAPAPKPAAKKPAAAKPAKPVAATPVAAKPDAPKTPGRVRTPRKTTKADDA